MALVEAESHLFIAHPPVPRDEAINCFLASLCYRDEHIVQGPNLYPSPTPSSFLLRNPFALLSTLSLLSLILHRIHIIINIITNTPSTCPAVIRPVVEHQLGHLTPADDPVHRIHRRRNHLPAAHQKRFLRSFLPTL